MADSLISDDLKIEGDINAKDGKIVVAGQIAGDINAGSVEIQAQGSVKGAIEAGTVLVHGRQVGKVTCSELTLTAKSEVQSDVVAKSMSSEKGAKLRGKVQISGS